MITGLSYIPQYISAGEQASLWQIVNAQTWLGDLKRRVQHYGYRYDYRARRVDVSMKIGDLPVWIDEIAERLCTEGIFSEKPDQVIVNEYEAGQGIASHIDCEPCFADTVVSISLGSSCLMDFTHLHTKEKKSLLLEAGSALVMKDESRYDWQHGITGRKSDKVGEETFPRSTRVSLTFRKVIL